MFLVSSALRRERMRYSEASGRAGFNAEVERLIIRYDLNDYFKVSFGRYHTPVNYWNTAFHHGQWLQTTISRPEMTQFGGQFYPCAFRGDAHTGRGTGRRVES